MNPGTDKLPADVDRHGEWDKARQRYADGVESHPCGWNCSLGFP